MTAPSLTDFLLARYTEIETVARSVPEVAPKSASAVFTSLSAPTGTVEISPARVLADVEAKRRIVSGEAGWCDFGILATLALPYADHPDYQEAWKP